MRNDTASRAAPDRRDGTLAILIPAYNEAEVLPRLLDSAARQTVPFDEVWVYDDCSQDETSAVAERYGARVVRGTTNRGCSFGKNELARRTGCGWIHFHDADDELYPEFSARARRWMERGDHDVVIFGREERSSNGEVGTHQPDREALETDALGYAILHQINTISGLYRTSSFLDAGGYDLDPLVLYNEDVAMHVRLAKAGLRFSADPEVLLINHRRPGSMSDRARRSCIDAQFEVLRKTADDRASTHGRQLATRLWQVAGSAASVGSWSVADRSAQIAVKLGYRPGSGLFGMLCALSPTFALRVREYAIRLFKPHLRARGPAR